ncbi:hypothetical protein BJ508DRAFT_305930 [Ascobolus immersus RN42]|uniref:Uncharacterized protein n=1 Tax=Ascobolus immersus RN42 TaxID=1160509 RepID=A0A3N4I996_ASCIM|nr:hypothetical protein BJ508DRAFT_305930 [Ascobolus immersus RN42]
MSSGSSNLPVNWSMFGNVKRHWQMMARPANGATTTRSTRPIRFLDRPLFTEKKVHAPKKTKPIPPKLVPRTLNGNRAGVNVESKRSQDACRCKSDQLTRRRLHRKLVLRIHNTIIKEFLRTQTSYQTCDFDRLIEAGISPVSTPTDIRHQAEFSQSFHDLPSTGSRSGIRPVRFRGFTSPNVLLALTHPLKRC